MDELHQRWVANLRSKSFKKGTKYLRQDDCYCSLGVLCVTALGPDCFQKQYASGESLGYSLKTRHRNSHTIPYELQEAWKITQAQCTIIMHANDTLGKSFDEIADIIEKF